MKDLYVVAKFTIKDMVKRKSFIISNLIILIMIVIAFNIPNIINTVKGEETEENSKTKILIIDENNVFEGTLNQLNNMELNYESIVKNEKIEFEEIRQKVENEEIQEALVITENDQGIDIEYIVKNVSMVRNVPENLVNAITAIYSNLQISKLNLTQEQLQSITPNFNFEIKQTEEQEVQGNQFAMMLMSIVLFYAIYFCAYQVSSSITTEKTSKIIETLVTSTTPKTIVLGKTIGIGIIGIVQIAAIIATALISNAIFLEEGVLDGIIDFSNVTPFLGIITGIYFILGYATYALLYALTGSTVSKPEDVQSANGPIAIIAIVGFYLAYFTMMNPTSELNKVAAILPISSPFCMPFRVMMGIATNVEIIISLLVLIATIFIVAQVSIKIYSQAILNTGSKMNFKEIVKMYKNKNV
ncbi:MAG: ABC transporter permease [Clostridia bacterium]|nr:ABC transporter permease [Clostridia bacterium]